jgi:hypothetical protein
MSVSSLSAVLLGTSFPHRRKKGMHCGASQLLCGPSSLCLEEGKCDACGALFWETKDY